MLNQLVTLASVFVACVVVLLGAPAHATGYTTYDHPSLPCNLSEEAVANWGETSAHLPLACTYDE